MSQIAAASVAAARRADTSTLYLVRHGTTTLNRENRYRGRRDTPLDAQGHQDAVDAARLLSGCGLTAVYSGPLGRTIATAQIIAHEARVPGVSVLHDLTNLDYGKWEGMTTAEAAVFDPEAYRRYRKDPLEAVCPSGERLADAQARMWHALDRIGQRHRGESVAVVTHAVMIRLALLRLRRVDSERWRIPLKRGSITTIEIHDGAAAISSTPEGGDID